MRSKQRQLLSCGICRCSLTVGISKSATQRPAFLILRRGSSTIRISDDYRDYAVVTAGLKAKLGPWKLASVVHRVVVLSTAHRLKRLPNPCDEPAVRTVLARARRASVKRGERPAMKTAITKAELDAMLATCDGSLEGIRDRALLCFGFASRGCRRREIAASDGRDLRRTAANASCTGSCTVERSKLGQQKARRQTNLFSIERLRHWQLG